jgi:hypothetical protein
VNAALESVLAWVETTTVATTVGQSLLLTASLSAIHLLGFTLVTGGALVANLRLLGALLPQYPVIEITRPASRGIALGLAISIATGLLLFAGKATAVSANGTFQLKMLLLVAAALFHFTWHRRVVRRGAASVRLLQVTGALGLSLWVGLALAGCAFILFE